MSGRSSTTLLLKMRKMSVAQAENSFQSWGGAPSSSQMIGIGYGSQTSATRSHSPLAATRSKSSSTTARMVGRSRLAEAGVKAGATRRRRRAWLSPSMVRIDWPPGLAPTRCRRGSGWRWIIESAEWKRLSRRMAVTSAGPHHRVPHVGAGEPVLGAGRLDGVDGVLALEADGREIGELELGDQLCHGDPRCAGRAYVASSPRARLVEGLGGLHGRVALGHHRQEQGLGGQVRRTRRRRGWPRPGSRPDARPRARRRPPWRPRRPRPT